MQFIVGTLLVLAIVIAFFMLIVPALRGIFWLIGHVFGFIGRTIGDALRILGGALTTVIFVPLVVLNIVIGRWSAARHFGTAIQDEIAGMGYATYRLFIGNPAHLLGLKALTEGIEQRVPAAMAKAPGKDKPSRRSGSFDGYAIVGSIAAGGSGAKLYIAEPNEIKRAAFARRGLDVEQVVIKSFSVKEGSSLPQIVRESRALEAAKKIGLVLEHDLNEQRFYYVMPYVPGEDLGAVGRHLHDHDGNEGLHSKSIREAMEYTSDLLETLEQYHRNGLWHKDVKPDNIIVHDGRAHLVDLGLVTPLRSAMTLTTHGTEYFRDPELVRMALKGVKVHEVNGIKFDIYAAGAVLYSLVENSFPAHGGLSHITKRCPEAVRWVIRRSMTEYDRRYSTANQMLTDLRAIIASPDIFSMKPAQLPSMKGGDAVEMPEEQVQEDVVAAAAAGTPRPPKAENASEFTPESPGESQDAPARGKRVDPKISVANWWTGRYTPSGKPKARMPMQPNAGIDAKVYGFGIGAAQEEIDEAVNEVSDVLSGFGVRPAHKPRVPKDRRAPASEQIRNARERAAKARDRVKHRRSSRCKNRFSKDPNKGVGVAVMAAIFIVLAAVAIKKDREESHAISSATNETVFVDANSHGDSNIIRIDGEEYTTDELDEFMLELRDEYGEAIGRVYNSLPPALQTRIDAMESEFPVLVSSGIEPGTLEEATWIVLDDLGDSASESARETFNTIVDALRVGGWDMIVTPSEPERVDLLASLRAELGTVQFGDPDAKELIGSWLRSHKDNVSGALWFPPMTDKREVDYRFYALEGTDVKAGTRIARRVSR